ncbi:MAG: DUF1501 domain-containing protein [Planctomycetes bacterium]|nr:DUF1501 domain-containing protein [Planctomycetota bacterium]
MTDRPLPRRRDFLRVGLGGALGLALADRFRLALLAQVAAPAVAGGAAVAAAVAKAQSVIHLFLPGGMAQQESFDPKQNAPAEYRGPYRAIDTKVSGLRFSEHFRQLAQVADRLMVVRTMSHGEAAHERGTQNLFTGYRPSPALQYPSFGSVVSHELGPRGALPPYVCIPSQPVIDAGSGYLSSAYGPFSLGSDPVNPNFEVQDLAPPAGLDEARQARRRALLDAVDRDFKAASRADEISAADVFYQRAYALLSSPEAKAAFDLKAEPEALRNEYGHNAAGQRLLLARRLAEAGVRWVTLTYGGWDHHDNIAQGFVGQARELDQALAALIRDLEARGKFDSTLVLVTTEFGRTPKINATAGRDHWPRCFSILMAGGGVKKGGWYGTSNATWTEPEDVALSIEEFAATVYHLVGIDAGKELLAPGNRPIEIVKGGRVVPELLA